MLETAILYIIFNRLDTVKQTFPQIKEQKPKELYIAADGPRKKVPMEAEKCQLVREWINTQIDWDCNLHTLYRDDNLGCGKAVSSAISWFFENVEEGIILEDDCKATDSFFKFSELMLKKYRYDNAIKLISGTSYLRNSIKKDGYYISNLFYIWGWATWRRAWKEIDFSDDNCVDYELLKKKISFLYSNSMYEKWLYDMIFATYHYCIDTWDLRLVYTYILNSGNVVSPFYNLISNVGMNSSRTDSKEILKANKYSALCMPVHEINFDLFDLDANEILRKKAIDKSIKAVCLILEGHPKLIKKSIGNIYGIIKKILKKIFKRLFVKKNNFIVKNIYNTNYEKTCLLSYITSPFIKKEFNTSHTNYMECKTAGEIFNELGYNVDAVDFYYDGPIDYSKYDIVYGMGNNLERSFDIKKEIKRIYYATGCNPIFSNCKTLLCARRFYEKSKTYALDETRYITLSQDKQCLLSDKVIVLGNSFTKNTYTAFDQDKKRYCNLNAFFYKTCNIDINKKNFNTARRHLIWFGSSGSLHKGLDIAIDLCLKHKDLILHICGANISENNFWNYYAPLINKAKNIIFHGYVDITSYQFKKLIEVCCFALFPSASEGCSPALLTLMGNGGLIPLTSEASGIDLISEIEVSKNNRVDEYERLIEKYQSMSNEQLNELSIKIMNYTLNTYTYESFKEKLSLIIKETLNV